MFNWLRRFFKKFNSSEVSAPRRTSRPNGVQPASLSDTQFIFESVLVGASRGYFNSAYLLPGARRGLVHQIRASINHRECPTHRGSNSESTIHVFVEANAPIGFMWVLATENEGERELYLVAVSPGHRSKGIGKRLVSETISRFPSKTKFVSRLSQGSRAMLNLLTAMGFEETSSPGANTMSVSYVSS